MKGFNFVFWCLFLVAGSASAGDSLEKQLATINAKGWVAENDITIVRFKSLLDQLDRQFVENRQQIGDMSAKTLQLLREDGIEESLLRLMEGLNTVLMGRKNQKFAEVAAVYIAMRTKGHSHKDTIVEMRAFFLKF